MIYTGLAYLLCVWLEYRSWYHNRKNGCAEIAPRFLKIFVHVTPLRFFIICVATYSAPLSSALFLLASLVILVPIAYEHVCVSDQASGGSDLSDPNPSEGSDLPDHTQSGEAGPRKNQAHSLANQRVDTGSDLPDHRQSVPGSGSPIRRLPTNPKRGSQKRVTFHPNDQAHSLTEQRVDDTQVGPDGGVDVSARGNPKTPAADHLFENLGLHGSNRAPVLIVQVFLVCYKNMWYRNGDKIEEVSAYIDWKTIYNSYQEHPRKDIAFFVFTDDERIIEHCRKSGNGAIKSVKSPTFANYEDNLHSIAKETGVYSLVTHFGMHASGGTNGGILFKNPDGGSPDIRYRTTLERANNLFLSEREDAGSQNVLCWTMVLDMCFAKNQTLFPVNYNLRKYDVNDKANVSIKKIHTEYCPDIYNSEQVVVICLSSSNEVNLSRELPLPGHPTEYYSPFTALVYQKGQQALSPEQTTPVKLCTSLNTERPDPIHLILPFLHLMDHSLAISCGGVKCENTSYAKKRNYGPKGYSTGVLYWSTNVEDRSKLDDGDSDTSENFFRGFIDRKYREVTHER